MKNFLLGAILLCSTFIFGQEKFKVSNNRTGEVVIFRINGNKLEINGKKTYVIKAIDCSVLELDYKRVITLSDNSKIFINMYNNNYTYVKFNDFEYK